jgi:hypothetical protein
VVGAGGVDERQLVAREGARKTRIPYLRGLIPMGLCTVAAKRCQKAD